MVASQEQIEEFYQDILAFTDISLEDFLKLQTENQSANLFLARPTCSYCRKQAKRLSQLETEQTETCYFLDSRDDGRQQADFRQKHGIKTVPALIHMENGQIEVKCQSSLALPKIQEFLSFDS
ncbi:thioredoxin family protein [Streptococcus loxodontisalivarius]|uniref:Bacteriocin transport accessory protein n=1 Tax=Streptococcus loxodontisalivarius TaxID=1349415 RepID=A0ABS2PSV3_9STRE|nr:thioredoxin family protein [Streptococcus loxodontisalivarius]MBM7643123.1 putative bacteriocin transport accessory protein [Streptococcus loxodontisalivarius]